MTAPHSPTNPDDIPRKSDLTLTHVAAAALAAVTTAVLGSVLGAAGTLIGAAGASVITTVGTAMYRSSLERSRDRVRSLTYRTRPLPSSEEELRTERSQPAAVRTPLSDEQLTDSTGHRPGDRSRRFAPLRWGAVVLGALGAFMLAMMLITGFEWASGGTVGDNGNGTTIGQVINDQPGPRQRPAPSSPPSPGAPVSGTPTVTPTATPTTPGTGIITPDGDIDVEPSPTTTSDRPSPETQTTTPPLLPTRLPGVGIRSL